ncbi:MAG: SIS domain-containing protein [Clostridia bacterium]
MNRMEDLFRNHPELIVCEEDIMKAYEIILGCYRGSGTVLVCGNGGSAADGEHIVGELMKGFLKKRPLSTRDKATLGNPVLSDGLQGALPAISLSSQTSLLTAFSNDVNPDLAFAQQVFGYRSPGNVLLALSTSGNSKNVVNAVLVANAFDMKTIGFTGLGGGKLGEICHVTIKVPAEETYRIQEYHLPVYHALCAMVEEEFYPE